MYRLETSCQFITYTLPLQRLHARYAVSAPVPTPKVFPPVQCERNVEHLTREGRELVQREWIAVRRRPRLVEELVVAHREQRLSVQLNEEQERRPGRSILRACG